LTALHTEEFVAYVKGAMDDCNKIARIPISEQPQFFAVALINYPNEKTWKDSGKHYDFYRENEGNFRKFLAEPSVQEKIRKRDGISLALKQKANELKAEFENVQEKIAKEYLL